MLLLPRQRLVVLTDPSILSLTQAKAFPTERKQYFRHERDEVVSFAQQPAWSSWDIHGGESKIRSQHHVDAGMEHLCPHSAAKDPRPLELSCAGATEQPNINTIKFPLFQGTNA